MIARANRPGISLAKGWWPFAWRYLLFAALADLAWEIAQIRLYTLATTGTAGEVAYAIIHCTIGDVMIAAASLAVAALALGRGAWPERNRSGVAILTIAIGIAYTVFSEWLNVEIRMSWSYSDLMPLVPPLGTGLSPIVQWLIVPVLGFHWGNRSARHREAEDAPRDAPVAASHTPGD